MELLAHFRWAMSLMMSIAPFTTRALFGLAVLSGVTPLLLFIAIRGMIDTHLSGMDAGTSTMSDMAPWFTLIIFVAMMEATVVLLKKKVASSLSARSDLELTTLVLQQANQLDVAFFDSIKSQEELSRLQGQLSARFVLLIERAAGAFSNIIQAATLTAILVLIEPLVLPIVVPIFLPYVYFQLKLSQHKLGHARAHSDSARRVDYYVGLLTDRTHSAEMRLLGIGDHIIERFRKTLGRIRLGQRQQENIDFYGSTFFAMLSVGALFYVFHLVLESTIRGETSMGELVVFAAAMIRMRRSMEQLVMDLSQSVEQLAYAQYLKSFLARSPSRPNSKTDSIGHFVGTISVENLSFQYPDSTGIALRDLNFSIAEGETVAIVGENGSGKSTLVKLIAGFYPQYEGSIYLSGRELRTIPTEEVRRNTSFVFQEFGRYSASAFENIAYGDWARLEHDQDTVEALAKELGLDKTLRAMPQAYDTVLGRTFGDYEPSGGVWQRIAIARAFAGKSPLLILDEPTASVDVRSEYELFKQLSGLAGDRTTLLISHRFTTVSMADRILVMRNGSIVEQGTHQSLIQQAGYYSELYQYYTIQMNMDVDT